MPGQQSVRLFCGELPRYFPFGATNVLSTTTNQVSQAIYKESSLATYQAILTGTSGALAATVNIQVTNDFFTGSGFEIPICTTTSGSAVVTTVANAFVGGIQTDLGIVTPPVAVGMLVVGAGIPAGAYVLTATNAGSITLSANATVTGTTVLQFFASNWLATSMGTITLSGTISATAPSFSDGFTTMSAWRYARASVSSISGTGASVQVLMGV
jgi:hypothetical protein